MSEELPPPDDTSPLARTLFGWAFMFKRGGVILIGLALAGLAAFAGEMALGRAGLDLPLEDFPVFYLVAGFGAVAAVLVVATALSAVLRAVSPAEDES